MSQALKAAGFSRPKFTIPKRLIMSVEAESACGKTTFALTSEAEPICLINFNKGLEGIMGRFKDKDIYVLELPRGQFIVSELEIPNREKWAEAAQKEAAEAWDKFRKAYKAALAVGGTVILDTASEMKELLRVARFGKLEQVQARYYGPVNAEYNAIFQLAYDNPTINLIAIHELTDEYRNDKRTGKRVVKGATDLTYTFQVRMELVKDVEEGETIFTGTIIKCRHNIALEGEEVPVIEYPFLLDMVHS